MGHYKKMFWLDLSLYVCIFSLGALCGWMIATIVFLK